MYKKLVGLEKYMAAMLLLSIPLYPKFPFISVPGTYVSIRLEDFLIVIYVVIWGFTYIGKIHKFLKINTVKAMIIYILFTLVSVIYAAYILKSVEIHLALLHWARRIEYFIPFLFGITALYDKNRLWFYARCLIVVVLVSSVYAYGQKHFSWPVITTQNFEYSEGVALRYTPGGHVNAGFAGHYDLASYLVMVIPFLASGIFFIKNKSTRVALILSSLAAIWLLTSAASRISLFAYFVAIVVAFLALKKIKALILVLIVSLVFAMFSGNLVSRYNELINAAIHRVVWNTYPNFNVYAQGELPASPAPTPAPVTTPVVEDRSTSIRLNVEWPRALRAFVNSPLTGTGFSSITLATDNEYLRALGETGIGGLLSLGGLFLALILDLLKVFKTKEKADIARIFCISFISSILGIFIIATFIDIFEASKFAMSFWFLAGLSWRIANPNFDLEDNK